MRAQAARLGAVCSGAIMLPGLIAGLMIYLYAGPEHTPWVLCLDELALIEAVHFRQMSLPFDADRAEGTSSHTSIDAGLRPL